MVMPYGANYSCSHGEPWGECCSRLNSKLVDSKGLDQLPTPKALVQDVLYLDSVAWVQGRPGSGKSFLALDIAACVAAEKAWQGFAVEPVHVLYVIAEGASGLRQRVRAWESAMGRELGEYLHFLPVAVQAMNSADWDELVDLAGFVPYSLIVLDTQARLTTGMEENSARDMGMWVAQLERLRVATGACVLVVHHQGRNGDHMRGSTAMEGAATTIIQVAKDDELVTVRCLKQKDAAEFDDIHLRLVPYAESAVLALTDQEMRQAGAPKWLGEWWRLHENEPISISVLVASGVTTAPTFHRAKRELIGAGFVRKEGEGRAVRYALTREPT